MEAPRGMVWILGGGIALVLLSVAGPLLFERWFPKKNDASLALLVPSEESREHPWIEILNANVSEHREGETPRLLASGDELHTGMIIAADQTGRAIIHFQNGSIARIDRDTQFTLETGTYEKSDKTLIVTMTLASGRIWSRIAELATPASLWEIKTANAVAVVRGTAFGIEYENGVSRVIGAENEVTVIPIDPKTKKRVETAAVIVKPDTFVEVTKDGATPVRPAPSEIKEADWMKETRASQQNEKDPVLPALLPASPSVGGNRGEPAGARIQKLNGTEIKPIATPNRIANVIAKELRIEIDLSSKTMREGEKKALRAIVIMSDGAKRDVSDRVTWKVIGAIGSIANNTFTPKLIGTQAEFGSAIGSLAAVFKTEDGRELIATTPAFEVRAPASEEFENTDNLDLRG